MGDVQPYGLKPKVPLRPFSRNLSRCSNYADRLRLRTAKLSRRKCGRNRRGGGFAISEWANEASASSSQRVTTTETSVPKSNPASVIAGGGGHGWNSGISLSDRGSSIFGALDINMSLRTPSTARSIG
jgi:hypothetical protein